MRDETKKGSIGRVAETTAFVLGGGGVLGAAEVGMLGALLDAGIRPDLVVGTSIGAINGAVVAADPGPKAGERLAEMWASPDAHAVFGASAVHRLRTLAKSGTHLHSADPLRRMLTATLGDKTFADLTLPFECCAASIERAAEHWFADGPVTEAVLASCAVPGLLPPVRIGDEHFLDGGLVNSIPVARAVQLGATRLFVMQVGRIDRPLTPPRKPWEVALVAFEIARRHRFARDMSELPTGTRAHILPTGDPPPRYDDLSALKYRDFSTAPIRIKRAYTASAEYLRENL